MTAREKFAVVAPEFGGKPVTRSEELIGRVRSLAHTERQTMGEATPLQLAALELAQEHEILVVQALKMDATIHEMTKDEEMPA